MRFTLKQNNLNVEATEDSNQGHN